jgi:hypothetical protein
MFSRRGDYSCTESSPRNVFLKEDCMVTLQKNLIKENP